MLAHEARDPAPVPQRPPREESAVGDRCVLLITHRSEGLDLVDEVVVMESTIDRKETQ